MPVINVQVHSRPSCGQAELMRRASAELRKIAAPEERAADCLDGSYEIDPRANRNNPLRKGRIEPTFSIRAILHSQELRHLFNRQLRGCQGRVHSGFRVFQRFMGRADSSAV